MKREEFIWEFLTHCLKGVFEVVNVQKRDKEFHIYLDEIRQKFEEDRYRHAVVGKGYKDYCNIKDHLTRGRDTFLHLRKCKWLDKDTGEIFSYDIDYVNEDGTLLSRELAAFLKGED